jgi:hypothetical protein
MKNNEEKYEFIMTYSDLGTPSGYTRLAYIDVPAGTYFDTGIVPNNRTGIDFVCMPTNIENNQFFAFGGAGGAYNDRAFEFYPWAGEYQFNFGNSDIYIGTALPNRKLRIV